MPELPELQAHAERLTAEFGGRELTGFRPIAFTALKTYAPPPDQAFGHALVGVGRRGKYLLMDFDAATFVVHLMQGGRLKPDEKQSAKPRGGLARWVFADGSALLLTEAGTEKRAGVWVREGDLAELEAQDPLEGLGPDADQVDDAALAAICKAHSMRLHGLLRDQRAIAGIGRRLANEICHRAKLSPFANASKLDADEIAALRVGHRLVHRRVAGLRAQPRRHELVEGAARRGAPPRPARPARCAATSCARSSTCATR